MKERDKQKEQVRESSERKEPGLIALLRELEGEIFILTVPFGKGEEHGREL